MGEKKQTLTERFFTSGEASLFVIGSSMLIFWVSALAILWKMKNPVWNDMLQMGFVHMLTGRAASIARGTNLGLSKAMITVIAVYMDVMVMMIVYPVLVFSYKHLFEQKFFKQHMRPLFDEAQKSLVKMRGFKIAGIFFFVWFPLWMTGIIVGAVIGYLLGLRTWVIMTTVILGTTCAVLSWVYVIGEAFEGLAAINPAIPTLVTAVIILVLVLLRYRSIQQKRDAVRADDKS